MILAKHEKALLIKILKSAATEFSYHGCNEVPDEWLAGMSYDEVQGLAEDVRLVLEYEATSMHESYRREDLDDVSLFEYFAKKLMEDE